jgi:hypothetical protein
MPREYKPSRVLSSLTLPPSASTATCRVKGSSSPTAIVTPYIEQTSRSFATQLHPPSRSGLPLARKTSFAWAPSSRPRVYNAPPCPAAGLTKAIFVPSGERLRSVSPSRAPNMAAMSGGAAAPVSITSAIMAAPNRTLIGSPQRLRNYPPVHLKPCQHRQGHGGAGLRRIGWFAIRPACRPAADGRAPGSASRLPRQAPGVIR